MKKAFFFDRDGVINVEVNYLHEPEKTELLPNVAEAVSAVHRAGYLAVVVTNQAGVAKNMYEEKDIFAVHARLQRLLLAHAPDAAPDAYYYCCHHENFTGECSCRKPQPGMLLKAAADFDIDLKNSFMIGDRMSDVNAGKNAGCRKCVLLTTGYGASCAAEAAEKGFTVESDILTAVGNLLENC